MSTLNVLDFGAVPNSPDSTDAIQIAMDRAASGDTVWIPPQTEFFVDSIRSVRMHSHTNLKVEGILRAIPHNKVSSIIVDVRDVEDVSISGPGAIIGERYKHITTEPGRHGFCLQILNSHDIRVGEGLALREAQADGLYIHDSKLVTVDHVLCADNARNGLSIISAEDLTVQNSLFTLTHSESPYPQAGIDIEPDLPTQGLLRVMITKNQFLKNKGAGCYIAFQPAANRKNVYVVNNYFDQHYKDGSGPPIGGRNTPLGNFFYATCRWVPGYDYWYYTKEFTC